jgi:ankyrin repeat protein
LRERSGVQSEAHLLEEALLLAIRNQNCAIVKVLVQAGADVNFHDGYFRIALQAASWVSPLAVRGVWLGANHYIIHFGNALQAASWSGNEEVVTLLLEKGANVNAKGGFYGNALQAASWTGCEEVVRLLLAGGANVSAHNRHYGSATQFAARVGGHQMIPIRANVNAQGGYWGNALQAAS